MHRLRRRDFLKMAGATGMGLATWPLIQNLKASSEPPSAGQKKTNVLFISVDDMNNNLGCCGNPQIKSPHLDRLASQGTLFAHNYNQYPLCNPSRSSLHTGMRPDTTRVLDNSYHFRQTLPDVVTLPQMFKNNGYYVARVGKIFHYSNPDGIGTNGLDDRASWTERFNPIGIDRTKLQPSVIDYAPKSLVNGHSTQAMGFLADHEPDEEHTDGKVAAQAIALLEAHKNGPFFIAAGFFRPHVPHISPQKYFDLYPMAEITLPPTPPSMLKEYPAAAFQTHPWPDLGVGEMHARACKQAYFAAISFVDAQIGRVLDALDRLGLRDNTIIVFSSDHGYQTGEHGLWQKGTCFEEAARTPLIISAPNQKTTGQPCQRIVEHLDIYPTVADLAGLTPPANLQGRTLRPLIENPVAEWAYPAFTQVQRKEFPGYSIRTEKWRYTEWDRGTKGVELYDHDVDPQELKNLAKDPQHADVRAQLKVQLAACHPVVVRPGVAEPDTLAKFTD